MTHLTPSQQQAIRARGNVLVVAGAGTGKTSTLVHRCISLLLEEKCSLDEILMVTFTEAAAAEMRSRIRAELLRLQTVSGASVPPALSGVSPASMNSGETPGGTAGTAVLLQEHVQKQLALLDSAPISTLHSFCLQLVRAHFYQLGIDPAVMVLDEKQTAPLIAQTLDGLFHRYYSEDTLEALAVHELIRDLGNGSDERIRHRLLKLHRYTQALGDPEVWLTTQEAIYQEEECTTWRRWLEAAFNTWRETRLPELKPYAHMPAIESFIRTLQEIPGQCTFEQAKETLRRLWDTDQSQKNWPHGTKSKVRPRLKAFLAELEFLASASGAGILPVAGASSSSSPLGSTGVPPVLAGASSSAIANIGLPPAPDPLQEDWQWVRPHVCTLLRLTREFTAAFSRAKRDLGGVDFSDLEQFALRLLRDPSIAAQWQERIRYIFVDECQDINRAQDAILTALSREGRQPNRFLVGDVKQSIYRFRLADPKIFCDYEQQWAKPPAGTRIPLSDNFRSREALLHFVNALFAALMRPEIGGVAYGQDVRLRFGVAKERKPLAFSTSERAPRVELHLIDQAATDGEPVDNDEQYGAQAGLLDLLRIEREARLVAVRLKQLREQGHLIWDAVNQQFRPAEWRDCVVLMRSPALRAEAFAKEFNQIGIPLAAARSGFFQSTEILDLLSLLKLIDNPLQDIPLLAVMRSPLGGFSLDELAEIRAHNREHPFWAALQKLGREPGNAKRETRNAELEPAKVAAFLAQFQRWRNLARHSSLSHCLETILTETHYEALLLAEPRGEERVANVRRFLKLAGEYDPFQRQGLYRFLRFVAAQEESEVDLEPASAQTENAVRLMSIHKSKGLEFPVVVLAGLGNHFNRQDLNQDILLRDGYGLCMKVKPPGADQSYPSLPYWLARREEQKELYGEEMRLLYVALTRARDTLILVGSCKNPRWTNKAAGAVSNSSSFSSSSSKPSVRIEDEDDDEKEEEKKPISTREILSARSYLDWLRLWLPQAAARADWSNEREGRTPLLEWRIYAANDPQLVMGKPVDSAVPTEISSELDAVALRKFQQRLLWRYPFAAATLEPAVKQVSTLIWDQSDETEAQLVLNYNAIGPAGTKPVRRTRSSSKSAAVDMGSAHHHFLEMANLDCLSSLEQLQQEASQMLQDGAMLKEEVAALDFKALVAFWTSEIGRTILSQKPNIQREIPFTARFSPEDFAGLNVGARAADLRDEYFVVRGKADLAVLLPKEIWLLDFKTGQFREDEFDDKVRLYTPQLRLYALALARIYRRPVTHCWLHFLGIGRTVSV